MEDQYMKHDITGETEIAHWIGITEDGRAIYQFVEGWTLEPQRDQDGWTLEPQRDQDGNYVI